MARKETVTRLPGVKRKRPDAPSKAGRPAKGPAPEWRRATRKEPVPTDQGSGAPRAAVHSAYHSS